MIFLVKLSLHMLSAMWKAAELLLRVSRWKNKLKHRFDRKKECAEPMKKSCLIAVVAVLAAVAGALLCSSYPTLQPTTGAMPGIKAFVAAVFGGIGSIPGAFLGGILLGIIENLSKAYISTQLSDAIVFLVLVVVLIVKPTGLLGKKVNVKV